MDNVEKVAKGLSEAMRQAIISSDPTRQDWITLEGLERGPLMERTGYMRQFGGHALYCFTPLGLAVRQYLQEQANG